MSNLPDTFKAFRIHNDSDGYRATFDEVSIEDLSDGELTIRTEWSSINYKDALAGTGEGRILRRYPLAGGIDVCGTVVTSTHPDYAEGETVLTTGSGLSETRDGGYSEYLRLPADTAIRVPDGLSAREAMALGTAGFTAALSLYRMEASGQSPGDGPIVVTGASGGVGSLAIDILTQAGYEAHAISGKLDEFEWLHSLGATQCISRHDLHWGQKPLESARWAGAIDNVGGDMLSGLTRVIEPWGNIASCGLAGGDDLKTTVMPFIIRGVSLIGINSAGCPTPLRQEIWERLAGRWKPAHLDDICRTEIGFNDLPEAFAGFMSGDSRGRIVVRFAGD